MIHRDENHSLKVLLPTLKQGYTSLLASALSRLGNEVAFFNFDSNEFNLSKVSKAIQAEEVKADVIHLHWAHYHCYADKSIENFIHRRVRSIWLSIDNLVHIRKLKNLGCKIVWTVHNSLSHEAKFPLSEYIFRWGLSLLSDDIIVMSHHSRQKLEATYARKKRIHVIPHGNFVEIIENSVGRNEARKRLGIPLEHIVLLNFGLMRRYKGIEDLLDAFQRIIRKDVVLLLAGNCSDRKLKSLIEESARQDDRIISHLRFIPDGEISVYMNASDWGIFPFRKVLNSGSVILTLSFARPVIVPKKGALSEIVQDDYNGILFDEGEDLASTINRVLSKGIEVNEYFSRNAFSSVENYTWEEIGKQHTHVYKLLPYSHKGKQ